MPVGFPKGPILPAGDKVKLKEQLNAYTRQVRHGEGAFGLGFARNEMPAKSRGIVVKLECTKHKKNGCGFYVQYEHTSAGWVLVSYHPHLDGTYKPTPNGHCHDLVVTYAEAMAASDIPKTVPPQLWEIAVKMSKANSIATINRTLLSLLPDVGLTEPTWTADYLRNHLPGFGGALHSLQLVNLMPALEERKAQTGLQHFVRNDGDEVLTMVWVQLEGALETWAVGGKKNALLFDPTFGTNKQAFQVCAVTPIAAKYKAMCRIVSLIVSVFGLAVELLHHNWYCG